MGKRRGGPSMVAGQQLRMRAMDIAVAISPGMGWHMATTHV